jgi:type I restriction enzyme, S subunit
MTSKNTKSANMPRLRFPEFVEYWEDARFDYWFKINAGGDVPEDGTSRKKTTEFPFPVFANSAQNRGIYGYARSYREEGDCVTVSGRGELGMPNARHERFVPIVRLLVLRPKYPSDIDFFENAILRTRIFVESTGVPQLTGPQLSSYRIAAPSLPEQKKIAAFLGVVDAKIAGLRAKVEGLETYKRGLMQALFSQTLRFTKPDGTAYPDWEEKKLGEVLLEHKAKSTGKEAVFSVSVHKGLVNQIEHLGRSFSAATTDHYNRVKPHDIVYTKSPTGDFPLGIIKQSNVKTDVIVSPLYGVFTPETPALGYMLHVYFESNINVSNYLSPIVQKGAKNTINVTNAGFLSNTLILPVSHHEQQKIADAFSAMDVKIQAVSAQVSHMETFKKGLLQQMFV